MIRAFVVCLLVSLISHGVSALTLDGEATQGGLLIGKTEPGAMVTLDDKPVPVTPQGDFLIGFGRDAKKEAALSVVYANGKAERRTIKVTPRKYRIQRIDGLPSRKVEPKKQDIERIVAEQKLFRAARARLTPESWFRGGFVWPAKGRISGVYGSQRILNGKPRRPHLGVDVAAPVGTKVFAAADGIVALAHEDMFFTGRTIHIDHGLGLGTVYAHLSRLHVKKGERVKKGQLIGRIGKTGRATGPHLHWGMTLGSVRLDPALVVGEMK